MKLLNLTVCTCLAVAMGLAAVGVLTADDGMKMPATQPAVGGAAACPACTACAPKIAGALAALDEAKKAADAGDAKGASAGIAKAQEILGDIQKMMSAAKAETAKAVNAKCPISGDKVDPAVPTREFKGQKVGFCCPMCLGPWDKLSDAEKQTKLDAAMK